MTKFLCEDCPWKKTAHLVREFHYDAHKLILELGAMAGNPDPQEGCRLIAKTVREYMDKLGGGK